MSKLIVRRFMTQAPHTIGVDQPLATAHELMRKHQIRHLPVLRGSKLVGMVTQRDLLFIENLSGVDPATVTVEDAMSEEPFCISPDTSLEWVAMEMAQHKYGSVVVLEHDKVVGVFTTIDALKALQELLRRARRRTKPGTATSTSGAS
jgi:acetoin utilization protein AcuB